MSIDYKLFIFIMKVLHICIPFYFMNYRGDPDVVMEEEETRGFWEAIGGEEEYYKGIKKKVWL